MSNTNCILVINNESYHGADVYIDIELNHTKDKQVQFPHSRLTLQVVQQTRLLEVVSEIEQGAAHAIQIHYAKYAILFQSVEIQGTPSETITSKFGPLSGIPQDICMRYEFLGDATMCTSEELGWIRAGGGLIKKPSTKAV